MGFKSRFKELGAAYLSEIEGAVGCRLDEEDYHGKTFDLANLTATLKRFYENWSPESKGLHSGSLFDGLNDFGHLHSAEEIEVPLRRQCRSDPGIFIIMGLRNPDNVRSLLMFADAILFWDPFDEAVDSGTIDRVVAEFALDDLRPLRPLIAAGLVVPAQLARTRVAEIEGSIQAKFVANLMWQAALGVDEFNKRLTWINKDKYRLAVPEGPLAAKGWRGHAENKVASLFAPDIVIPHMDYRSLSSYQTFCKSIDDGLRAREVEYFHKSLAFETGFLLDPEKLTNLILLELRKRDSIFVALRNTVVNAMDRYEESVSSGGSAAFVEELNIELQDAFRELKARALVSNTWKEYVDESRSFSTRFMAKVFSAPLHGKLMFADWFESFSDAASISVANVMVASLKTYARYGNTKVLMDMAGAIREHHEAGTTIAI